MRAPGTFRNHATQAEYIALSRVADVVGCPASEITNAISNGTLPVHEISGCKCVLVTDLFQFQTEGDEV